MMTSIAPDPVHIRQRFADQLKPISQWVIVLTHHDGVVEVAMSQDRNIERPYRRNMVQLYQAAKEYRDTGCYASVVVAPVRTTFDVPSEMAYEEAIGINRILTQPGDFRRRKGHEKWIETE